MGRQSNVENATIKEKRLVQAVKMSNESRFQHPDEEVWIRMTLIDEKIN